MSQASKAMDSIGVVSWVVKGLGDAPLRCGVLPLDELGGLKWGSVILIITPY